MKTNYHEHNEPKHEELIHKKGYRLLTDYKSRFSLNGEQCQLIIPAPYEWDGMSIPWLATGVSLILPNIDPLYPMGPHKFFTLEHDREWEYKLRLPVGQFLIKRQGVYRDIGNYINLKNNRVMSYRDSNRKLGENIVSKGYTKATGKMVYRSVQYTPIAWLKFHTGKLPEDTRGLK